MKLTIMTETSTVGKDGLFFDKLDISSCGVPTDVWALQWDTNSGHIEFIGTAPNQGITVLPNWANSCVAIWQIAYDAYITPKPPTAEQNREAAIMRLQLTDWATIPDVADSTKSNPYLANVDAFNAYRNAVRQYAISPVAGNIDWPAKPNAIWVNT